MVHTTYGTSQDAGTAQVSTAGVIWLKLAIAYLLVGVGMGIFMGVSHDFALRPVHAHVNLLGWTTLALAGLIYCVFPRAGRSRLAKVHFWLMNVSLPVMMTALGFVVTGHMQVIPVLAVAEIVASFGVLAFAANLFLNLKSE